MKGRVSLIAGPIWFSFIVELLIGNWNDYFGVGYLLSLKRNRFHKKKKNSAVLQNLYLPIFRRENEKGSLGRHRF